MRHSSALLPLALLPLLTGPVGLELEQLEGGKLDDDVHRQPRNHTWQAAGGGGVVEVTVRSKAAG